MVLSDGSNGEIFFGNPVSYVMLINRGNRGPLENGTDGTNLTDGTNRTDGKTKSAMVNGVVRW